MPTVVKGQEQGKLSLDNTYVVERAAVIQLLSRRLVGDIVEIGRLLTEVKQNLPHGDWLPWLRDNFGWSNDTALNFMRSYEMVAANSEPVRNLQIDVSALYLLAKPSTPERVREKVLDLAKGEYVSKSEVQKMLQEAREAGRKEITLTLVEPAQKGRAKLETKIEKLQQQNKIQEKKAASTLPLVDDASADDVDALRARVAELEKQLQETPAAARPSEPLRPETQRPQTTEARMSADVLMALEHLACKTVGIPADHFIRIESEVAEVLGRDKLEHLKLTATYLQMLRPWSDRVMFLLEHMRTKK